MSAVADFMLELDEATSYARMRLRDEACPCCGQAKSPSIFISRKQDVITVRRKKEAEYAIKPVPREDYETSRRMKGWLVTREGDKLEMARSYEGAVIAIEKDMDIYKDGGDDGLPR